MLNKTHYFFLTHLFNSVPGSCFQCEVLGAAEDMAESQPNRKSDFFRQHLHRGTVCVRVLGAVWH